MEIPYKVSYMLIFSIVPFMGAILLLFIRFLFFEDKDYIRDYNTNKKVSVVNNGGGGGGSSLSFKIQLTLFILSIIGFVFTISSFSSWNYLPVGFTIILSIILLVFFTLYQLIVQFEVERKKRIFKVRNNKNKNYFVTSPNAYNSPVGIEMIDTNGNSNKSSGSKSKKEILLESLNIENNQNNNNSNSNSSNNNINSNSSINNSNNDEYEYNSDNDNDNDNIFQNDNGYFYYKNQIDSRLSLKESIKVRIKYFIKDTISTIQYTPKLSLSLIGLALFLAIFIPLVLEGVCICSHPMYASTRFTRRFQESYCKKNEICFIYLTLPENPSNSMILQFHTRNQPVKTLVSLYNMDLSLNVNGGGFDSNNQESFWESTNYISMSDVFKDEPRFVSYIDFQNLNQFTNYRFNLTVETKEGHQIISDLYSFKTFSNDSSDGSSGGPKNLKFVVGGDVSINKDGKDLAKKAHKFEPDFLIVGGDISYEDGIGSCYRRLDEKLKFFTKYFSYDITTNSGSGNDNGQGDNKMIKLTPLLMSIGNHEGGAFFQTHKQVPFYFKYFIFNLGDSKKSENERLSYHIHQLPFNTSMTSLDSCVISTWSDQTEWLNNKWSNSQYNNTNKLVVYHHPIYESWGGLNGHISKLAQQSVVPLFDHYKVPFAFENHEHLFKRTRPLYNNSLAINNNSNSNNNSDGSNNSFNGTIYVGDGSWGISYINEKPIENDPILPWYLIKRSLINHLWFTTINQNKIKLEAYSPDGDLIDKIEYFK